MIYPVESASPSREARIHQGEDEAQRGRWTEADKILVPGSTILFIFASLGWYDKNYRFFQVRASFLRPERASIYQSALDPTKGAG